MSKLCRKCGCAMPRFVIRTRDGYCIVQRCRGCGDIERLQAGWFATEEAAECAARMLRYREVAELFEEVN